MKTRLNILILIIILTATGCSKQEPSNRTVLPIKGAVEFYHADGTEMVRQFDLYHVEPGNMFEMSYQWETRALNPVTESLHILVHFVDQAGRTVWQDDHRPIPGVNTWKPEQKIQYRRVVHLPEKLPERIYEVKIGFYDPDMPDMKYFLANTVENVRKKTIARVRVAAMMKVRHKNGWLTQSPVEPWRWAGQESSITVTNVKFNTFLHLQGFTTGNCFPEPPLLNLVLNRNKTEVIPFENDRFDRWIVISSGIIGTDGLLDIDFKMNGVFVPVDCGINADTRELSAAIYPPELTTYRYREGFYPPESEGLDSWRWMGSQGTIEVINPGCPARLAMELWTSFDRLDTTPNITLLINNKNLTRFTVSHDDPTMMIDLNELIMGDNETFTLTIKTDTTFTAGNADSRQLGLMVKSIRIIPLGS